MTKTLALFAVALMLLLPGSAGAVLVKLTPDQVKEAVEWGKAKFDQDAVAFSWKYLVDEGLGKPKALVRTEYFAIADFVRRSEYQRAFGVWKVHKLTPEAIEEQRQEAEGKLVFQLTDYGESSDFSRNYRATLKAGEKIIPPLAEDYTVEASPSGFPGKMQFKGGGTIVFPIEAINPSGTVTLVVERPGKRPLNFPFNLGTIK